MISWWKDFFFWWFDFYLVEDHLCVGTFLPRCLDCLGPGGVGVGSCLSARRFLFKGIVVLCKSWYDKTWHSRKFSQHRPLWLHCTTGECNFSKYTRKHNVKNINKNHKKNKNKLTALYWTPPAPPPPPRNKGLLLPDSGAVSRLLVMICFLISIFSSSIADWVSNGSWHDLKLL